MDYRKRSLRSLAFEVFVLAFLFRLSLTLYFKSLYGAYAVNHVEAFLYKGVMDGVLTRSLAGFLLDPTAWVLGLVGLFVPDTMSLWAVELLAMVLSSLTAVCLLVLANEIYGKKVAYLSAQAYAILLGPLLLSVSGFTHDHLQLPVILASVYVAVKAIADGGRRRLWIIYAFMVFFGFFINTSIFVSPMLVCAYYLGSDRGLKRLRVYGLTYERLYVIFVALAAIATVTVVPAYIGSILERLPQGPNGSSDVMPVNLANIWLNYNFFFLVLPFGLYVGYKRRDFFALSLLLFGLSVATQMVRGTRVSDFGVALFFAFAADGYLNQKGGGFFSKKARAKNIQAAFAALLLLFAFFSKVSAVNTIVLAAASIVSLLLIKTSKKDSASGEDIVSVMAFAYLILSVAFISSLEPRQIVSQAEYDVLSWLKDNNDGGAVLAGWDRGYMIESVSELNASSTPAHITYYLHKSLWMPDRQAALTLSRNGVRYVLMNSENFELVKVGNKVGYRMNGDLVTAPSFKLSPLIRERTAIYKLRYAAADKYFNLLRYKVDRHTGVEVLLYEVVEKPLGDEARSSFVGAILENTAGDKLANVTAQISFGQNTYDKTFQVPIREGEVLEETFMVRPYTRDINCSVTSHEADVKVLASFC